MKKRVLLIVILFLGFITLNISRPVNATVTEAGSTNITIGFKENKSVEKPTNVPDRKHNDNTPNKGVGTSVVGGILPQTNEEKSITAFLVGLIILLGTLLLFYIRRDKKEENNN
ncbi:LPXTG cell wall anchor domain-containing protein [Dellaglioa carnosa]|uniref:LPXTG cell wall anchor domain-containing protein n=1 Tax=Dellaglioa carnosa TaxID=2995136 RepID=A0ABT4JMP7_9LACO|nr:LPXTG cell wall anchor domain-containing protein [Dellaglioa carnosa]MCZ2491652.1 LPXTG cell wall anchor domain-containing protein [Dellaglioa carnosa]MCZ2494729.1 LPXTG cell wall anchor domain-containing protein [Dellaglioa carnosa]MDK1731612.1 LPXTG cell wall anchor domain-containing protein [Dellaglioa carnosa]